MQVVIPCALGKTNLAQKGRPYMYMYNRLFLKNKKKKLKAKQTTKEFKERQNIKC